MRTMVKAILLMQTLNDIESQKPFEKGCGCMVEQIYIRQTLLRPTDFSSDASRQLATHINVGSSAHG